MIPAGYQVTEIDNPHLGGFIHGGDGNTWCPAVWERLIADYDVKSVLDLGCGEGQSLDWFLAQGIDAWGIEGSEAAVTLAKNGDRITLHDFAAEGMLVLARRWSLCWCAEFVEHIEERYWERIAAVLRHCDKVAMTHAEPGQEGWHHVNCQPAEYWIEKMRAIGFRVDMPYSVELRVLAGEAEHVKRSLLVFERAA